MGRDAACADHYKAYKGTTSAETFREAVGRAVVTMEKAHTNLNADEVEKLSGVRPKDIRSSWASAPPSPSAKECNARIASPSPPSRRPHPNKTPHQPIRRHISNHLKTNKLQI
jgi:hypothetical protein